MDEHHWTLRDALTAFALVIVASGLAEAARRRDRSGRRWGAGGIILGVVGTAIGMMLGSLTRPRRPPVRSRFGRARSVGGVRHRAGRSKLGFGYGWASFLEWLGVGTQPQTYVDHCCGPQT